LKLNWRTTVLLVGRGLYVTIGTYRRYAFRVTKPTAGLKFWPTERTSKFRFHLSFGKPRLAPYASVPLVMPGCVPLRYQPFTDRF
jgi:hypothetical protein